jgi:alpha-D-xyloside xylohydrolase
MYARVVTRVFLFTVFSGANVFAQTVQKMSNGVLITLPATETNKAKQVKVQAITDNIFRITASATENIPEEKSLMVLDSKQGPAGVTINQSANTVSIVTAKASAEISLIGGEVVFRDTKNNVLLKELTDGRTLTAKTVDGEPSYIIRQAFISDNNESLYGLGQHQAGSFDYKGTQVLLSQYNTEVAIPFMVSNKNYGILWDNNSISKTIDTREYEQLSSLKLFSKAGEQGWLTATYSDKNNPDKIIIERPESLIDYSYIPSLKTFPDSVKLEKVVVTWEGYLQSAYDGEHVFNLRSSGYAKIYMDGKLLASRWRQSWNPCTELIKIKLQKGKQHSFKIEWNPTAGEAFISCHWLKPLYENERNEFAFESEAGNLLDYYFIAGSSIDDVISGYRQLTGKATMLPKWAFGFWQSRERYKTQDEIINTVAEFRKRKIPIDNIVEDWNYWEEDKWGSHEFDKTRFPDAEKMIKELHEKYNTQLMISVWPKFYEGIPNYNKFKDSGWIYNRNVANRQRDWIGKGYVSSFYDAYHPGARKLFWELMNKHLYSKGIDAWWMDATEPDICSNLSPQQRKEFSGPNYLGSSTKYYNGFALMNAKAVYEGQRNTNPNKRVFILTRSAYGGLQRYGAATWSGDIASRWEDFKNQIPAGLNFSMSGLPYWTTDIGGFAVEPRYEKASGRDLDEWREQNTRWYQYGVFCPLFRVHGQYPYREIFNIAPDDHPAYKSMLYYSKLRYRLMPYIYSLAAKTYFNNYTIMRALPMDFPGDAIAAKTGDQFMFGSSLLVSPVYEFEKRNRNVYLPAGTGWYDFYTGKFINGGQTIDADAPYEKIPLFIKEGSIIPCGPDIQYTGEKYTTPLTIYVFAGSNANFALYEDEGTNYNYEKGLYSEILFQYNEDGKELVINERKGNYTGMVSNRKFRIIRVSKSKPNTIHTNNESGVMINYSGKRIVIKLK